MKLFNIFQLNGINELNKSVVVFSFVWTGALEVDTVCVCPVIIHQDWNQSSTAGGSYVKHCQLGYGREGEIEGKMKHHFLVQLLWI